jgi:hypothetical protein
MFSQHGEELVFVPCGRSRQSWREPRVTPSRGLNSQMLLLVNRHLTTSTSAQLNLRNLLHVMPALEMIVSISCSRVRL